MKRDRNCGGMIMPYPTPYMMPQPMNYGGYNQITNNTDQITNIEQRLNNLENRIAKLENKNITNYNNKYNDSNYYML